jgi:hypothetical protein
MTGPQYPPAQGPSWQPAPPPAPQYGGQPGYGAPQYGQQQYGTQHYGEQQYGTQQYGEPQYGGYPPGFVPMTPPKRQRPVGLIVAAVVVVLALAVGGFFLIRSSSNDTSSHADTSTAGWTSYSSPTGQFQAKFPDAPVPRTVPASYGPLQLQMVVASDSAAHMVVESATVTPSLPTGELTNALNGVLRGVTTSGTLSLDKTSSTTFQGRSAVRGEFSAKDGTELTGLAIGWSGARIYLVLAPADKFDALLGSFVVTG